MDILVSLIEECNLYQDNKPKELLKMLNIVPESTKFDVTIYKNDEIIHEMLTYEHPMTEVDEFYFEFNKYISPEENDGKNSKREYIEIELPINECEVKVTKKGYVISHGEYMVKYVKAKEFKFIL